MKDKAMAIERIDPGRLSEYCGVPTLVDIRTIYEVREIDGGLGGIVLEERPIETPWVKDYDSYGETPADWPKQWDLSNWCFLLAKVEGKSVGAACIATRTKGVNMLEGRDDLAVLWDIRVSPGSKRRGVGRALFTEAVRWSREQGMTTLKIETQNYLRETVDSPAREHPVVHQWEALLWASDPSLALGIQIWTRRSEKELIKRGPVPSKRLQATETKRLSESLSGYCRTEEATLP
jgi:GNAT superfamily N-acetyltransferase